MSLKMEEEAMSQIMQKTSESYKKKKGKEIILPYSLHKELCPADILILIQWTYFGLYLLEP